MSGEYIGFIPIVLLFILFLVLIILGIREKVVQLKLSWSGVKVDGRITDHRTVSGRGKSYYLTYDYDYNGLTYSRDESVSSDLYHKLTNGVPSGLYYTVTNEDKVSVICLPEHPKTARIGYKIPDTLVGKGIAVALILIGIAVVIFLLALLLWWGYGIYWATHLVN